MEEMKSITIKGNNGISKLTKLRPKDGDVFVFFVETDDNGIPKVDFETIQQSAKMLGEAVKPAIAVFMLDKFGIYSCENYQGLINGLQQIISSIQEAAENVGSIKNGNPLEPDVVVRAKDILDGNM